MGKSFEANLIDLFESLKRAHEGGGRRAAANKPAGAGVGKDAKRGELPSWAPSEAETERRRRDIESRRRQRLEKPAALPQIAPGSSVEEALAKVRATLGRGAEPRDAPEERGDDDAFIDHLVEQQQSSSWRCEGRLFTDARRVSRTRRGSSCCTARSSGGWPASRRRGGLARQALP